MIYAMSDIHGQYELFRNLMEQIPLGKDDTLYVLSVFDFIQKRCWVM